MTGISSRKDFGHCFAPDLISPEVFIARVRGHCPGHANVVFAGVDGCCCFNARFSPSLAGSAAVALHHKPRFWFCGRICGIQIPDRGGLMRLKAQTKCGTVKIPQKF